MRRSSAKSNAALPSSAKKMVRRRKPYAALLLARLLSAVLGCSLFARALCSSSARARLFSVYQRRVLQRVAFGGRQGRQHDAPVALQARRRVRQRVAVLVHGREHLLGVASRRPKQNKRERKTGNTGRTLVCWVGECFFCSFYDAPHLGLRVEATQRAPMQSRCCAPLGKGGGKG